MASPTQLELFADPDAPPTLREVADAVRVAGIEGLASATERADHARYQHVHVKSAVTESKGMPFRWALNPYRGCTHACEYCYARKYQRHLELGAGDEFSSFILVKRNLPAVLHREVTRASWQHELVAVGTATDPYQPIEGHYKITRQCLEILDASNTPFSIVTKGPMVVRDLDVLLRATGRAGCQVFVSIPSVETDAWSRLEPGTASPQQRLRAVRHLVEAGVDAGVLMMPLVPGITTTPDSISRTIAAIVEAGVPLHGTNVARLDAGVREYFFDFLSREYPALVPEYEELYRKNYADRDYCTSIRKIVDQARARTRRNPADATTS